MDIVSPDRIAHALLQYTCHDVCAVACISQTKRILSMNLFDPLYFEPPKSFSKRTAQIWLIANHECGNPKPTEQEWRHFAAVCRRMPETEVHFFLCSEYWKCREISLAQRGRCDIMNHH